MKNFFLDFMENIFSNQGNPTLFFFENQIRSKLKFVFGPGQSQKRATDLSRKRATFATDLSNLKPV